MGNKKINEEIKKENVKGFSTIDLESANAEIEYKAKKVREMFIKADNILLIDKKRKNDSLRVLAGKIEEKQIRIVNNKKLIWWNQLKYMDKSILRIHILICFIILPIMEIMNKYGMDEEDIILASVTISGILGVVSIIEISHIFFSGIAEISESCYFNVRQLVAFNMLISGILNLTILTIGILFVGFKWKMELIYIGLYLLVPFVLAECCCLGVLLSKAGRKNSYLLVMVGAFIIAFSLILASAAKLYRMTAFISWGIAFIVGVMILGVQIKILFSGIKKGEIICTN